jgi:hypothetical protein
MGQLIVPTVFSGNILLALIPTLSYVGMIVLHTAQFLFSPPTTLPDLYEVLWSVAGCSLFSIAWLVTVGKLYFSVTSDQLAPLKIKPD